MRMLIIGAVVSALSAPTAFGGDEKLSPKLGLRVTVYQLKNAPVQKFLPKFRKWIDGIVAKQRKAGTIARDAKVYAIPDAASNALIVAAPPELHSSVVIFFRVLNTRDISKDKTKSADTSLIHRHSFKHTGSIELTETINNRVVKRRQHSLNDEEARIAASLLSPVKLNSPKQTLLAVIRDISSSADINVVLDSQGLKDLGLKSNSPIKVIASGDTLEAQLHRLLTPLGLGYGIRDEVLYITSSKRLRGKPILKIYPVADLIATVRKGEPVIDFAPVIREIKRATSKQKTDSNNKTHEIGVVESKLAIAVRQSEAGHRAIAQRLSKLRRERLRKLGVNRGGKNERR